MLRLDGSQSATPWKTACELCPLVGKSRVSKRSPNVKLKLCYLIALAFAVVLPELRGSSPVQDPASAPKAVEPAKKSKTPGKEMSQGGKDIGKGAAKGSADLAKGTASGAGKLATGHPVSAGASAGKGAAGFGKNVGGGAGKGTAKIGKGIGGEFKKLGKKSGKKHDSNQ